MNTSQFKRWVSVGGVAVVLGLAGVTGAGAAAGQAGKGTTVRVILQQTAAADSNGVMTYVVQAVNTGGNPARNLRITVPFDGSALRPMDATFKPSAAWVSNVSDGALTIQTDKVASDSTFESTVRFQALPGHHSAALTERLTFRWSDGDSSKSGVSNDPDLTTGAVAASNGLVVEEVNGSYVFSSSSFAPGEPVVFWYNTPAGDVVSTEIKDSVIVDARFTDEKEEGAAFVSANADGAVRVPLRTKDLVPGVYTMVARGDDSGITVTGVFTIH